MKKLLLIVLIALVGVLVSCLPAEVFVPEESEVRLSHWGKAAETTEFGNLVAIGYVKNIGSTEVAVVEVEATFYDASGSILGKYSDYYSGLKPGETWKYSVMYLGLDPGQVRRVLMEIVE